MSCPVQRGHLDDWWSSQWTVDSTDGGATLLPRHRLPAYPTPPRREEGSGLGFSLPSVPPSLSPGDCPPVWQNWPFRLSVSESGCWSHTRTGLKDPNQRQSCSLGSCKAGVIPWTLDGGGKAWSVSLSLPGHRLRGCGQRASQVGPSEGQLPTWQAVASSCLKPSSARSNEDPNPLIKVPATSRGSDWL